MCCYVPMLHTSLTECNTLDQSDGARVSGESGEREKKWEKIERGESDEALNRRGNKY